MMVGLLDFQTTVVPNMYLYCFIFAIKEDIYFKIGISSDINQRLQSVQTGNPFKLYLLFKVAIPSKENALLLEKSLHTRLWKNRLEGEWFTFKNLYTRDELRKELKYLTLLCLKGEKDNRDLKKREETSIEIEVEHLKACNPKYEKLINKLAKGKRLVVLTSSHIEKLNLNYESKLTNNIRSQ